MEKMETVEVVINIPKEDYEFIYDEFADGDMPDGKSLTRTTLYAIANGTVLPKGHGRLFDSNVLWDAYQDLGQDFCEAFDFAEANAIIEADREA